MPLIKCPVCEHMISDRGNDCIYCHCLIDDAIAYNEGIIDYFGNSSDYYILNHELIKYYGVNKSVIIPHGIKRIAKNCFSDNQFISSIKFVDDVEEIDECAINNCINLEFISLGKNIRKISNNSFVDCLSLKKICYGKNVLLIDNNANNSRLDAIMGIIKKSKSFSNARDNLISDAIVHENILSNQEILIEDNLTNEKKFLYVINKFGYDIKRVIICDNDGPFRGEK